MNNNKRPPKKKNEKPITGEIFYPTSEEGKELLIKGSTTVVLDILERKLGVNGLDKFIKYYKENTQQKA